MTGPGSSKLQAPSSKQVPSFKPQRAALDGDHIARGLGLELEIWSLLGAWSLELGLYEHHRAR